MDGRTDRPMDGRTEQQTDGWMGKAPYKDVAFKTNVQAGGVNLGGLGEIGIYCPDVAFEPKTFLYKHL